MTWVNSTVLASRFSLENPCRGQEQPASAVRLPLQQCTSDSHLLVNLVAGLVPLGSAQDAVRVRTSSQELGIGIVDG